MIDQFENSAVPFVGELPQNIKNQIRSQIQGLQGSAEHLDGYNRGRFLLGAQKLTGLEAENFTVFIPDGTTGNFPAYLSTLTNVYFSLMGAAAHDKQNGNDGGSPLLLVINDLLVWSARVSSTPEFINQSWNLPNASKLLDPAKGISELKKYYNPSLRGGSGICKLSVAYPKLVDSLKSVDETFTSVATKLNEDLMYDWTKKLNELSVSLDRAIVTLQKYNHGSAGTDNLVSKTAVKALQEKTNQINQFIYQTAQCIELLSVVLYQLKVCSECYFKTVAKINDSL